MKDKIKTAKETKKETVANLVNKIKRAKSITFADYRGLTAVQIGDLRKKVKETIAPIRIVADFAKNLGLPNFKFGFFGKDLLDSTSLETLSKIPPRDVLYAKLVGALNSPIFGVV